MIGPLDEKEDVGADVRASLDTIEDKGVSPEPSSDVDEGVSLSSRSTSPRARFLAEVVTFADVFVVGFLVVVRAVVVALRNDVLPGCCELDAGFVILGAALNDPYSMGCASDGRIAFRMDSIDRTADVLSVL